MNAIKLFSFPYNRGLKHGGGGSEVKLTHIPAIFIAYIMM